MINRELLYEGKAKRVYKGDEQGLCIIEYKNTATAFNGEKKAEILNKGELNCAICSAIYDYLEQNKVPTHFIKKLSNTSMLVKQVKIIPLEVIARNIAAGSFSKKYGVKEGVVLKQPAFEFSYKDDALGDPMINTSQALALELASKDDIDKIMDITKKVNILLSDYFGKLGLKLVDFKLEFGLFNGNVVLADEISPDTCRLWDIATNEKLDKDRFRRDMGGVSEAYSEVYRRIKEGQLL